MSWEARIGGTGDAETEGASLVALAAVVEADPSITYHAVRSEHWGEGDLLSVAAGKGATAPGAVIVVEEVEEPAKDKKADTKARS